MSTLAKKPNWALLALSVFVAAMVVQSGALLATMGDFDLTVDVNDMRAGYERAREVGTSQWWFGEWINLAIRYFRPLISYAHYGQFWLLDNHGFQALTLTTMLLYAAFVVAVMALAYSLTARPGVALASGLIAAAWPAGGREYWLAYFPYIDGIAAALFEVLTVLCFLIVLRHGKPLAVVGMWSCFVAAALCKEHGYITPALCGVLALGLPAEKRLRIVAIAHAALLCVGSYLILSYARHVVHLTDGGIPINNFWLGQAKAGNWWVVALLPMTAGAIAFAVMKRRELDSAAKRLGVLFAWIIGVIACIMLAPANDLPRGAYAIVYLADNYASMLSGTVGLVYAIGLYGTLGWIFLSRRYLAFTVAVCLWLTTVPIQAIGGQVVDGREVFLLPFLPLLLTMVALAAINRASKLKDYISLPSTLRPARWNRPTVPLSTR